MKRQSLLVLAVLALCAPASAGHRYHFYYDSGEPTGDSNPPIPPGSLARFTISWDSDNLMIATVPQGSIFLCSLPVESFPNFATSVITPGYQFNSVKLCIPVPPIVNSALEFDLTVNGVGESFSSLRVFSIVPGAYNLEFAALDSRPDPNQGTVFFKDAVLYIIDTWEVVPGPVPVSLGSRINISLVEGPAIPLPGAPVEAVVGFTTLSGAPIGTPQRVTVVGGRVSTLQFDSSAFLFADANGFGTHADVIPVVTLPGASPLTPPIQITTEVQDKFTGFSSVLTSSSQLAATALAPQALAGGQVMRIIARATTEIPCIAMLGFKNASGGTVGPAASVNLSSGQSHSLDLSADVLRLNFSQSAEVQPFAQTPVATLSSAPGAPGTTAPAPNVCSITSEVFDTFTGRSWSYQNAVLR